MSAKYALKDIYVAWDWDNVWLVSKSEGKPKNGHYFDPAHWKGLTPAEVFFDWFTILTVGWYEVPPHYAGDICRALEDIKEFEALDNKLTTHNGKHKPRRVWQDRRPPRPHRQAA